MCAANEDIKFREYLAANGFDVSLMGLHGDEGSLESKIAHDKNCDPPSDSEEKEKSPQVV